MGGFSDLVVEDTVTQKRYRADHIIEHFISGKDELSDIVVEDLNGEEMGAFIQKHNIQSEAGNPLSAPKTFDLLMETKLGSIVGEKNTAYLRGETAQGIFINFKNILDTLGFLSFVSAIICTNYINIRNRFCLNILYTC